MAELYQGKFSGEEIDSAIEKIEAIQGLPTGGTAGQVLAKVDGTNYNVTWVNQQGGGSGGDVPAGGTTGQVLAKSTDADYQTQWVNQPEGLPEGGTTGQVVTKTDDGAEWADAARGLPAGGTIGQILSITDDTGTVGWINPEQAAGAPSIVTTFGSGNRFFYVMTIPSQGVLKYSTVDVYMMNKLTINSSYNFTETIPEKVRPTGGGTYRSIIRSTDNTEVSAYITGTTMNIDTSKNGKVIPEGTHVMSYMRKA